MAMAKLVNQNEALVDFLDDLLSEEVEQELVDTEVEEAHQPQPQSLPDLEDALGRKLVVPDWGRQPFQAMVFKVRDLSLAVPLQSLSGVINWVSSEVSQEAGTLLLLGQTSHAGKLVNVVDTARFVFPDEQLTEMAEQGLGSEISRIILINNGLIGLACDEVYEVIDIQPEQVTWRSQKTRRKWLAGTMLEEMIVLLDGETLADILAIELGLPPAN